MSRIPFDQLAKQYLEDFLEPLGTVQRSLEVPGESKLVDLWFTPNPTHQPSIDLGLLSRIARGPCLLEPFSTAPTRQNIKSCLLKLLWVQENQRRQLKKGDRPPTQRPLPKLWILAAKASKPILKQAGGKLSKDWGPGVYHCPSLLDTTIVAIDQLPITPDTLWLRILGRDQVQQQAVSDLLALPRTDPRRDRVLQMLINWRVTIELPEFNLNENDEEERSLMVALSQAYYEWEATRIQQGIQQGKLEEGLKTVLRLLGRRVGPLSDDRRSQVQALSLHQIEDLADCLLDFTSEADLTTWLQQLADRLAITTQHLQQRWEHLPPDRQSQVQQLAVPQLEALVAALPQLANLEDLAAWLHTQLSVD